MEYETCPVCSTKYNVSLLRDKSRVFICEDCTRRDSAKIKRRPVRLIYDRRGFATVRNY